jgi:hypothetical protein
MWEYMSLSIDWKDNPVGFLNDLGGAGWELVATVPAIPAVGSDWSHRYLLKRKVPRVLVPSKSIKSEGE